MAQSNTIFEVVNNVDKFPYFYEHEWLTRRLKLNEEWIEEWAYIVHDRDKDEDGNLKRPHVHIYIKTFKRQKTTRIAKTLGLAENFVEVKKGRKASARANALRYLCHRTKKAKHTKYQYDYEEVVANFNYIKFMKEQDELYSFDNALYNYAHDKITKAELIDVIQDDLERAIPIIRQMKDVEIIRERVRLKKFIERHTTEDGKVIPVKNMWFYGKSGTGKTSKAIDWAKKRGLSYYVATQKDPFGKYDGEQVIIIDDLRSGSIDWSDLLTITDPYRLDNKQATARYCNKNIIADYIIVTSVYDPYTFAKSCRGRAREEVDSVYQLLRRFETVLMFDKKFIFQPELWKLRPDEYGNVSYFYHLRLDENRQLDRKYMIENKFSTYYRSEFEPVEQTETLYELLEQ